MPTTNPAARRHTVNPARRRRAPVTAPAHLDVVDLTRFDVIIVNSSAGKDSQATLDVVTAAARAAGVLDRVVVLHCDLGHVEWPGVPELAAAQAAHYGVRFAVRGNPTGLLDLIRHRGRWPAPHTRYCTSATKRQPARKYMTELVNAHATRHSTNGRLDRPMWMLNCLGMRAAESHARARKPAFAFDPSASNHTRRKVWTWLPVHTWTEPQVWDRIHASRAPYHPAYDLGMRRLQPLPPSPPAPTSSAPASYDPNSPPTTSTWKPPPVRTSGPASPSATSTPKPPPPPDPTTRSPPASPSTAPTPTPAGGDHDHPHHPDSTAVLSRHPPADQLDGGGRMSRRRPAPPDQLALPLDGLTASRPPRPGRRHVNVPPDPGVHAHRIATAIDAAWTRQHGTGTDLHIPAGVVAALALCAQDDPNGPDLAEQITALEPAELAQLLRSMWKAFITARPDLTVRLTPLVAWLYDAPSPSALDGAHAVARAALHAGQLQLTGDTDRRRRSDLLGTLLQILRGPKAAASRGAYYTPQPVAEVMARMLGLADAAPGQSIGEPAAGTGIMLCAAAHILREHGKNPADYRWYANDIDPLAAACLAINTHLWGLGPNVLIACADGLDPDWPRYAATDRAHGIDGLRTARMIAALHTLTNTA